MFHVHQSSAAEADGDSRYEISELGRNIYCVNASYGYMEEPDIRGALAELRRKGELDVPSDRWIIEVGEEELIISSELPLLAWLRVVLFRWVLRLSTPAHKYFGPGSDAGITRELIPVLFTAEGIRGQLPELEIAENRPDWNPQGSA